MRWVGWIFLVLLLTGLENPARAAELEKVEIKVGYIRSQFHGVNQLDAEAAFRILSRTVGKTHGYEVDAAAQAFDSSEALSRALHDEILHITIMDTWSYLELADKSAIEPVFVHADRDQVLRRFLLLAKDERFHSLEDLRGKSLNILSLPTCILGQKWFSSLLVGRGFQDPRDFFVSVEYFDKPMNAVLPVFFGKKDAVLVDEVQLALMAELNPQLNTLKVVVASEPLLASLVCFSKKGWKSPKIRKALYQALLSLHESPAGQQILTLFKTERAVPYTEKYLQPVEKLFQRAVVEQSIVGDLARSPK